MLVCSANSELKLYNVYETCATVMQYEKKCGDFEILSTLIGQSFLLNIEYDQLEGIPRDSPDS